MTDTRWKNYATMVETDGGYRETGVFELLAVAGEQVAGARILQRIEQGLAAANIGHFPTQLPRDQNARVLLYRQDLQGPGSLLHLVRQLTETGTATASQIVTLHALLLPLRKKALEGAAPA
ncbi:hypothetical protein ABZT04_33400 [Streptomyces sp. NPDC005492]|uniref:hypothetical protein n=1 Tax=Streptomyces sp. NPDC005492 TaxID=3156883 RepID=UPI0033B37B04